MKKWIISILAVLIVGGGATTAAVLVVKNQPENVAISALAGIFDDALERQEIEPLVNMIKGGSLSVDVSHLSADDGKENPLEELGISKIGGKIYFSDDNKFFIQNAGLDLEDGSIRGDLFVSDELVYVKSDLLGGAYGVKMDELLEQFEDSIFHYSGKSDFSLTKSESGDVSDLLESFMESAENEDFAKDASDLFEYYVEKCWEIFCENVSIESDTKSVKVGKEKINARVISFSFDDRDIADALEEFAEFIDDDDKIEKFVNKYEDMLDTSLEAFGIKADDLVDEIVDFLDMCAEEVDDSFDKISVEIVTPKLSSKLLKLTVKYEEGNFEGSFILDCGKDGIAKSNRISVTVSEVSDYTDYEHSEEEILIYEVSKNDSGRYTSSLRCEYAWNNSLQGDEEEFELLSVDINKKTGKFSIKLRDEAVAISGKWAQNGDATTFTLQELARGYDEDIDDYRNVIDMDIRIVVDEKDSMPSVDKYTDLAKIEEDDVYDWKDNFEALDFSLKRDDACPHYDRDYDDQCDECGEWLY